MRFGEARSTGGRLDLRVAPRPRARAARGRRRARRGSARPPRRGFPSRTAAERQRTPSRQRAVEALTRHRRASLLVADRLLDGQSQLVQRGDADGARQGQRDDGLRAHAVRLARPRSPTRRNGGEQHVDTSRGARGSGRARVTAKRSSIFKQTMRRGGGSGHQPVPHGPHAGPAVGAPVPAAVAGRALCAAMPPLVEQELFGHAAPHVIPWQRLERLALTRGLVDEVAARAPRTRRARPCLVVVLGPGVEARTGAPRRLDDVAGDARRRGRARPRAARCGCRGARAAAAGRCMARRR